MADPIIIYTDGAASGNPGPGGFGVVLKAGVYRKELMAGFRRTTNNRMELLAVIVGLEALKQPGWQVVVYSDSRYVAIYRQHQVKFVWVKGHADIPENERCDQLAVQASKMPNLQIDYYYEAEQDNNLKLFI